MPEYQSCERPWVGAARKAAMKKLVALVAVEIVAMTCLGIWLTSGSDQGPRRNAFTALSYAVFPSES
jgi:hypothetical protein